MEKKRAHELELEEEELDAKRACLLARRKASYLSSKAAAQTLDDYIGNREEMNQERHCLTPEELQVICEQEIIEPISRRNKKEIYYRGRSRMHKGTEKRVACAVCDRGYPESDVRQCTPIGKTAERWKEKLSPSDDVPFALREFYNVENWLPQLRGALLSKRGVVNRNLQSSKISLFVCFQGYDSMRSGRNPPKFSIANGFDIGELPKKLADARSIECRLTSLTSLAHSVVILRGGRHKSMKGHLSVMRINSQSIHEKVPRLLSEGEETFLVVMAGQFTPLQKVLAMKRHLARVGVVRELLRFFASENVLYKETGVRIDEEGLRNLEKRSGDAAVVFETVGNRDEEMDRKNNLNPIMNSDRSPGQKNGDEYISELIHEFVDNHKCESENSSASREGIESGTDIERSYSETAAIYVESNPHTSVEVLQEAERTPVVRNRGPFVSYYEKKLLGLSFPDIFPYGRGHPGTERGIPVSVEECCRYYLSLASRRFAQHSSFLLICFDICGRQRVVKSTCVRSFCRPGEFEDIAKVTREELSKALQKKRHNRERILSGVASSQSTERNTAAGNLLYHVKVSQANMWGSAEEKLIYRRQAFSMDAYFKTGAIFVTITPSETGNLTVAAIAGRVCTDSMRRLEVGDLPSHSERACIAGSDPVACSEYFELVCNTFIEDVIGFNRKKELPYKKGGLFGHAKAFLGVVEAQSSGTLHLHAIVFVAGLPRTVKEFTSRCEDGDGENAAVFQESVCRLIDGIISTTVPCSPILEDSPQCPKCEEFGSLVPATSVPDIAFKKQSRGQKPVPTSKCEKCDAKYGGSEIIRSEMVRLHRSLDEIIAADERRIPLGETYRDTDRLTEHYCLRFAHNHVWPPEAESANGEIGKLHRLLLSRIVTLSQQHSHLHVDSCFKSSLSSKQGHCRYGFPRKREERTHSDEDLCLNVSRRAHNEYINSFNDVISLLFRTNHDIRFLLGGTTDAFYYVLKYVTKAPTSNSEVERAVIASYDRRR